MMDTWKSTMAVEEIVRQTSLMDQDICLVSGLQLNVFAFSNLMAINMSYKTLHKVLLCMMPYHKHDAFGISYTKFPWIILLLYHQAHFQIRFCCVCLRNLLWVCYMDRPLIYCDSEYHCGSWTLKLDTSAKLLSYNGQLSHASCFAGSQR